MAFSFLVLGVSSLVTQVVLFRELLIVFYGNEFFIGWTLFAWLFWVGAGALGPGRVRRDPSRLPAALTACHLAVALLFPAAIAAARIGRGLFGSVAIQTPDLLPSLAWVFAVVAPLGLVLGAQFAVGARAWSAAAGAPALDRTVGRAYLFETAGFAVGGLAFNFALAVANEYRIAGLVGWLNALAGSLLQTAHPRRSRIGRFAVIAVTASATVLFLAARPINLRTLRLRFPEQDLVESVNSIHGNVAVTRIAGQHNFFENGLLFGASAPDASIEWFAHFPLLYHPAPRRVLIIGGGLNGLIAEALKHGPAAVDYVELDPQLVRTAARYLDPGIAASLRDPRVNIRYTDGRRVLRNTGPDARYDVVIVNLPNPSTALINRFFSREFYRDVRAHLAPDGLLAARLDFSPDYLSPELGALSSTVHATIGSVFEHVLVLPEYSIYFIASAQPLAYDPALLAGRIEERAIETRYLTPAYINYRLTTDRIPGVLAALKGHRPVRINRDLRPSACFDNFVYWTSSFHGGLARMAARIGRIGGPAVFAVILAGTLIGAWSLRAAAPGRLAGAAIAAGSFTLMAAEVLLILAFQVFHGHVYHRIALLIASLMVGMAAGTHLANRGLDRANVRWLAALHAALAGYAMIFLALAAALAGCAPPDGLVPWLFLFLAALAGGLVGFEFPVANKLYLAARGAPGAAAGVVYGLDLAGSCLGALLVGVWLLPVIGLAWTLFILAGLNLVVSASLFAAARRPSPS